VRNFKHAKEQRKSAIVLLMFENFNKMSTNIWRSNHLSFCSKWSRKSLLQLLQHQLNALRAYSVHNL